MTPQEALQLLDNLCKQIQLTYDQHQQVREAVRILTAAIVPGEP